MSAIPTNPSERSSWVRHELALRGTSYSAIARRLAVSPQAVHQAMYAPRAAAEAAIAEAIGLPVGLLFPERFLPDGTRRHRTREDTRAAAAGKVKTRGPAGQRGAAAGSLRG